MDWRRPKRSHLNELVPWQCLNGSLRLVRRNATPATEEAARKNGGDSHNHA